MKIRKKIVLLFTFIVSFILIIINAYIYFFSSSFSRKVFTARLKERATIAATVFLEEDEISTNVFNEIRQKYFRTLHGEIIRIYDLNNRSMFVTDTLHYNFPSPVIEKVRKNEYLEFTTGDRSNVGLLYRDNQGDFVILVSAIDFVGIEKIRYLEKIMVMGFFCSLIILVFVGRFLVDRVLTPISSMVREVKNITATNLHLRIVEGNGKDEFSELAITFNQMLSRIEQAFEMQKRFIHHASHELRNPLTSIIGEAEVSLSKARSEEEYKRVLHIILYEAERLNKLTSSLLHIVEMSSSSQLAEEEVRIDELLWEVKHDFTVRGKSVQLAFAELPAETDDLLIKGNKNLLYSAFYNVIDNGIKFSNDKPVQVKLLFTPQHLRVEVCDQGIGISGEDMNNIFQLFFRGSNALSYPGSGIGLSLFEKIIQLHNGSIEIHSEPGKGTCIYCLFPI